MAVPAMDGTMGASCLTMRGQKHVPQTVNAQNCFPSFLLSTVTARAVLLLFNVIETNFLRASSTSEFSHSLGHQRTWQPGNSTSALPPKPNSHRTPRHSLLLPPHPSSPPP